MHEHETEPGASDAAGDEAPREDASIASALQASAAIAAETAALAGALARLAGSEAVLSARSFGAALGWRVAAALVLLPAWVLLVVAAVAALANATGSLSLACLAVAAIHLVAAAFAFLRARALSTRVGFARTRAALGELAAPEPPP